jgi:hypothetical protein
MKVSGIFTAIIILVISFCSSAKAESAPVLLTEPVQELKMSTNRSKPGIINFSIPSSSFKKVQFTVYNESGVAVLSEERAASDLQVDIKALKADGTYTFTVVAGSNKYSSQALIML